MSVSKIKKLKFIKKPVIKYDNLYEVRGIDNLRSLRHCNLQENNFSELTIGLIKERFPDLIQI